MKTAKKGFISTPLLGTIIFLIALVFVVNLSLSERNAVSQATTNAYDNRLVSLIDSYNLDAASQMTQSVKSSVEGFLGGGCWTAFNIPYATNSNSNLSSDRFQFCNNALTLIKDVACTQTTSSGYTTNTASGSINSSIPLSNTFGLQQELTYLISPQSFESFNLYATNAGNLSSLLGNLNNLNYQTFCNALLGTALFDCNAFAAGKFQCCLNAPSNNSVYTGQPECNQSDSNYVPGCEDGTFYFMLNLTDSNVYPYLPRVGANDSSGNFLNSNVLAYSNPYIYINYPLFKYFNATYTVVQTVVSSLNSSPYNCKYAPGGGFSSIPSVSCSSSPSSNIESLLINSSLSEYGLNYLNFTSTSSFLCPSAGTSCPSNLSAFFTSSSSSPWYFNAPYSSMSLQTNDWSPLYLVNPQSSNQFCMDIKWDNAFSYVTG